MSERWDDLMRCGYKLLQNPDYFCFGMDAVLLSGFARVEAKESVIDLGSGNGIIPILLAAKTHSKKIVGLEIQPELVSMAKRSVEENRLSNRVEIVLGDICKAPELFAQSSFDIVTTNPPYMVNEHGLKNEKESVSIARHEILCSLEDVLQASGRLLKPKGRLYMVHRPFRLAEIFYQMKAVGIEPKRMRLVFPYVDKEPNMVLIEGIKGARERIIVEKPLIVYESQDKYTEEILKIYGF